MFICDEKQIYNTERYGKIQKNFSRLQIITKPAALKPGHIAEILKRIIF